MFWLFLSNYANVMIYSTSPIKQGHILLPVAKMLKNVKKVEKC